MPELILDHKELNDLSVQILSQGSSIRFKAGGTSMTPFIRQEDILTVRPVDPANLRVGDVIFYRSNVDRLVAHRVLAVRPTTSDDQPGITARGDSSLGPGEEVRAKEILGQVVSVQHGPNKIMQIDTPFWRGLGHLWILIAPAILRLRYWFDQAALKLMRQLSSLKAYRFLASMVIGKRAHIHRAEPQDAENISLHYGYTEDSELLDPTGARPGQFQYLQDCGFILTADLGDLLVGSLTVSCFPKKATLFPGWWLFGVLVRLRYRGAGIGCRMLELAIEHARTQGVSRLNVLVNAENSAALKLFEKAGFLQYSIPSLEADLASELQRGLPPRIVLSRSLEKVPENP